MQPSKGWSRHAQLRKRGDVSSVLHRGLGQRVLWVDFASRGSKGGISATLIVLQHEAASHPNSPGGFISVAF